MNTRIIGIKKYGISKVQIIAPGLDCNGDSISVGNGNTWLRVDENGKVTTDTKNYKFAIEFNHDAITVTWKNTKKSPVTGKYQLLMTKKDSNNTNSKTAPVIGLNGNDSIAGAKINIKQYLDKTSNTPTSSTTKTATKECTYKTTGAGYSNSVSDFSEVKINNSNTYDWYIIEETTPPTGYMKDVDLKLGLILSKGTSVENEKYSVYDVEVVTLDKNNNVIKRSGSLNPVYGEDGIFVYKDGTIKNQGQDSTDCRAIVTYDFETGIIAVTWKNPQLTGSYNLSFIKKSTESDWADKNISTNGSIADAEFTVQKYQMTVDEAKSLYSDSALGISKFEEKFKETEANLISSDVITTTQNWKEAYQYGGIEINKDNASYCDVYRIEETKAPKGYNKNENIIYLVVTKKANNDNTEYIIDDVGFISTVNGRWYGNTNGETVPNYYETANNITYYNPNGTPPWELQFGYSENEIYITYADEPIELDGNYNLQLIKKSTNSDWADTNTNSDGGIATAEFKVQKISYINLSGIKNSGFMQIIESQFAEYSETTDNITTSADWTKVYGEDGVKINKDNVNLCDIYRIEETKAPEGYKTNNNCIYLVVNKKANDNNDAYIIDSIGFIKKDDQLYKYYDATDNSTLFTTVDGITYYTYNDLNIQFAYDETNIWVTYADEELAGSYKMQMVKNDLNYSTGESTSLGEAEFTIKQYINRDETDDKEYSDSDNLGYTVSSDKTKVILSKSEMKDIYYGESATVEISDTSKIDIYTIEESSAPSGYEKSGVKLIIQVHKDKSDEKYIISSIDVITKNSDGEIVSTKTVSVGDDSISAMFNKDGNEIEANGIIKVTASKDLITLDWKEYPIGTYKLQARKIDTSGDGLNNAKFSLTKTGETSNLFSDSVDEDGYTSIYSSDITSSNLNVTDYYTLTEVEAPEGYMKLQNSLNLEITKKETNDTVNKMTKYELNTITLSENNTENKVVVDFANDVNKEVKLSGVLLEDGKTTVDVIVKVNSAGIITISVENANINGGYSYYIYKTVDGQNTKGIQFELSGAMSGTLTVIEKQSSTIRLSKEINKDNLNDADIINVKEITNDDDILGLQNSISLTITKASNNARYMISNIKVEEKDESGNVIKSAENDISDTSDTTITLSGVSLTNGIESATADLKIVVTNNGNYQVIAMNVENKKVTPKTYKLKINKIDATSKKAMAGRKFNIYKINSDGTRDTSNVYTAVTDDDGNAVISLNGSEAEFTLDSNETDKYAIQEVYDNDDGTYLKIENYEWILSVDKTGTNLSTYALSDTSNIVTQLIDGKVADSVQQNIANKADVTVETANNTPVVNITIQNQSISSFNFELNKVDVKNTEIGGSNFSITVCKDNTEVEKVENIDPNNQGAIEISNVIPGDTYKIYVRENSAPSGYRNLFIHGNSLNGSAIDAYLLITATVDQYGNINVNSLDWVNQSNDKDQIIKDYLTNIGKADASGNVNEEDIVSVNGSSIVVNLPNEKDFTSTGLELNKHSYGNTSEKIEGIAFSIKRAKLSGDVTDYSTIINAINNGTSLNGFVTNTTENSTIDDIAEAELNATYIYEITENVTSIQYHDAKIESAIVKVYVNSDKTTSASIIAVKRQGDTDYVTYSTGLDYADRISIDSLGNNSYTVNWANDNKYELNIIKKGLSSTGSLADIENLDGISANFTIKQVTESEETIIVNDETISTKQILVNNAKGNEEYTYTIKEVSAQTGYTNIFGDSEITIKFESDKNGEIINERISKIGNITDVAQLTYLKNYIKVDASENVLNVYIVNPKEEKGIKFQKISNTSSEPIEGVSFEVTGPGITGTETITTDAAGLSNVLNDIPLNNGVQKYTFTEVEPLPAGVTKLDGNIILSIDTTGITTVEEITNDKISVSVENSTTELTGLSASLVGDSILLTVPNPTNELMFNIIKQDQYGNKITADSAVSAVRLSVQKTSDSKTSNVLYGYIPTGEWSEGETTIKANSEYIYTIREINTKKGYINYIQGYSIKLHLKTDANAKILEINETEGDSSNGNSYYEIVNASGTRKYSKEDIINKGMLSFSVVESTETNLQTVTMTLKNPQGYKVQLNKTDLNGNSVNAILQATRTSDSTIVKTNAEQSTIIAKNTMYLAEDTEDEWQIKELSVDAPYYNILEDKVVNVYTKWSNQELVVSRWNIDGNENSEYKNYVDVTTEKIDDVWTLKVTIKDPVKVKIKLKKVGQDGEPLSGATLKMNDGQNSVEIKDGASESDYLEKEISLPTDGTYSTFGIGITETETAKNHINVLEGKTAAFTFVMDTNFNVYLGMVQTVTSTGTASNLNSEYYSIKKSVAEDQTIVIEITIKNPMKYNLKIVKVDSDGNELDGASIKITKYSTDENNNTVKEEQNTNGEAVWEYTEEEAKENTIMNYYIDEIKTPGNQYVNILGTGTWLNLAVNTSDDGSVSISEENSYIETGKEASKYLSYTSRVSLAEAKEKYGITVLPTEVDNNGISTVGIKIENTIKTRFKVLKKQATSIDGEKGEALTGAKFKVTVNKVENSDNGNSTTITKITEREGKTISTDGKYESTISRSDLNGTINSGDYIEAGDYVFRFEEEETSSDKYVNILEDKYIEVNVHLSADGKLSFKDENNKYVLYTNDGVEITDASELEKVNKYVNVSLDTVSTINEVIVEIQNPVSFTLQVLKEETDGTPLAGAEFSISNGITNTVVTNITGNEGTIDINNESVQPGVYKYEVQETKTTSSKYNNILENHKLVFFVKIDSDGYPKLVKNTNGDEFTSGETKYYVYDLEGNDVTETTEGKNILSMTGIVCNSTEQEVLVRVENPVNIRLDIVKKNTSQEDINNSTFMVCNENGERIYYGNVTSDNVEISELGLKEGYYDYYIKEVFSGNYYRYVNNFKNMFIKVSIRIKSDGTVKIVDEDGNTSAGYFRIYEGNVEDPTSATLVDTSNGIYSYVEGVTIEEGTDGINTIKAIIENPTAYDLQVVKQNAAGSTISGGKFTIYRTDENGENKEKVMDSENPTTIEETPMKAGNYIYYLTETEAPSNKYENILESQYIKVYVKVDGTGVVHITNSKFQASDNYFETYEGNIENIQSSDKKIENSELINVDIVSPLGQHKYTVKVTVKDTVKFNIDITKMNAKSSQLSGSNFIAVRKNVKESSIKEVFDGEVNSEIEVTEKSIEAGKYIYYFTETKSPDVQYNNILDGMYIKVYCTISGDGKITITDSSFKESSGYFELYKGDVNNPKDTDESIDTSKYSSLVGVTVINPTNSSGTIKVSVVNTVNFKVVLNKKVYGSEEINLADTNFTIISEIDDIVEHTDDTDSNGNIEFTEESVRPGYYLYKIRENKTAGNEFINILENKELRVYVRVYEDGTIKIVNKYHRIDEDAFYIYDISDESNPVEVEKTSIILNCISVGKSTNDGIAELDINIKNPQKYSFTLTKKDKDTNEKMNGVTFNLTVNDESGNIVKLKDANTLEEKDTTTLVTKTITNEDGTVLDGAIQIKDILFEKSGTYKFILHEESTNGIFDWLYKTHATDIVIQVNIEVQNGSYIIKDAKTIAGGDYVSDLSVDIGIGVENERIKGKYDLKLNKVDSYTGEYLDGAEFAISAKKDGEDYTIYQSTSDVNSKDVLVPSTVTVTDGKLEIKDLRIEAPETYTLVLTETKAPAGYMLLDNPIEIEVTTKVEGEDDNSEYVLESAKVINDGNYGLVSLEFDEDEINVTAKDEYFDLSLRKSITSVAYANSDESKISEDETKDRVPEVITKGLVEETDTTAVYNHDKTPVKVYKDQEVIYTLRVYNEGEIDGYAEEITDHLPEWLEFVDDEFNKNNGWELDETDTTGRTVKTRNLSKEYGEANNIDNLLKARNNVTGELDYREIQIKCRVSDKAKTKTILTNIAEISESKSVRTSTTVDRDSVTDNVKLPESSEDWSGYKSGELTKDYVPGQEDDDDFEKVIVEEFDLSLRKYITDVNDEELLKNDDTNDDVKYEREPVIDVTSLNDGTSTTATYTHTKEPVEVSVGDIVTYTISVYNEGTVSGYASLIKDDIPEGLEFVADSEINKKFGWKLVDENDQETNDVSKAKYIVTDYLSKENGEDNLIKAFDGEKLDTKYVQVDFRVICRQDWPNVIENQAQISDDEDENGNPVKDRDSTPNEWNGEDDEDVEYVKVTYMDLALRKFITGVNDVAEGKYEEVTTRIPQVDATALKEQTATTATYTHTKDPVLVHTSDIVTYTIRVYNEGSKDGYATGIKDDIPQGLEYLPSNSINKEYEWKMLDENGNETTDVTKAVCVETNYLSKDNETSSRQNLMKAFDSETMDTPEYKDVKIAFRVVEPTTSDRIVINSAQISEQTDGKGIHREDRDSIPNEWNGEDDEDIEKVRVQYFDLALRKWVTKAIVTQNGETTVTETGHHAEDDPEEVVKVDLKKSKINSVVVKFEYQIRITNEGEIAGYAKEIKDRIPEGLRFIASDNPNWTEIEDGIIVTDELKDTLLQPGESAEVTVVLTWINSATNMGLKVNVAEISKDYNEYGTPDIDSTPDNNVEGEDDIDDAPVMLTVKTGSQELRYILVVLDVLAILAVSVKLIENKRKEHNN